MNTPVKLNEGEKLELDLKPQGSLTMYNTISNLAGELFALIVVTMYAVYKFKTDYYLTKDKVNNIELTSAVMLKLGFIILVVVLLWFGFRWFINSIKVGHMRYVFTDQRCIIYSGFIGVNKQVIPYNRIADVDITQGTFEAMFKISSVEIDEQAMNIASQTYIKGLAREDAEAITDIVSKHISKKQT
jgi:membrane protein YdbS with pleckstrin-like domain